MNYLVFFDAISSKEYEGQENRKIEYLSHCPEIGDRISMGGQRLWTIVGVDPYLRPENPEEVIYLAHCTIDPQKIESVDRSTWFRVRAYQEQEPNLQLFFGEGVLLRVSRDLIGGKPEVGYLLSQYNPMEQAVTSRPWGITSVASYFPSADINQPCYLAVHVCQCVYVPEALESDTSNWLVHA
ncbi:MAG: hypothetical protein ICV63_21585 [Coleofasciculus sp. Co-bin14]|nr:hypothetical protein [Coleofasciculus sp. Co-bin14]